jgi:hypothetical protein
MMVEEQYRIAYVSQGALAYHEVGTLTTEEREMIIDSIKKIKEEERRSAEKATGKSGQQYSTDNKPFSSKSALNSIKK